MIIRSERPEDKIGIYKVNAAAFETPAEANLVDVLREKAHPTVSLVAEEEGKVVGHIMFAPVTLSGNNELTIMGLGPMAVAPMHHSKGIGTALVKAGLERCREIGFGAVTVLGHTWFYPRFGFMPSIQYGIGCEYEVSEDVFMVIELSPGYLGGKQGIIKYHPAFNDLDV